MATRIEELEISIKAQMGNVKSQLSSLTKQVEDLKKGASSAGSAIGMLGRHAIGFVAGFVGAFNIAKLAQLGQASLKMANDVNESEQLFSVSLGKMEDRARGWSDRVASELHLNPYELRKSAGVLNVMFNSMGVTEDKAYEMATSLTELAQDMASFYNIDPGDMFSKLQSGMTGMAMPLKQLGILVDEETVKQYAMRNGLVTAGKEMTAQQKVMARYGAIMEQTQKAQGDLARTIDSPTNQLRRLNNEIDQAKIALGQALQPALKAVLPHVTSFAAGLGRMFGAEEKANPLKGSVIAAATVADMLREDAILAEKSIDESRERIADAIRRYASAVGSVRQVNVTLDTKIKTNVLERIDEKIKAAEDYLTGEDAPQIFGKVRAYITASLVDGKIDGLEKDQIQAALNKSFKEAKGAIERDKNIARAKVQAQLDVESIDKEKAQQLWAEIEGDFAKKMEALDKIRVDVSLEMNVKDWTITSDSVDDKRAAEAAAKAMTDAAQNAAADGVSFVRSLFATSAELDAGVNQFMSEVAGQIGQYSDIINEHFKKTFDEGTNLDWGFINEQLEKQARYIRIMDPNNVLGQYRASLLSADAYDPDTAIELLKGYQKAVDDQKKAYAKEAQDKRTVISNIYAEGTAEEIAQFEQRTGASGERDAIAKIERESQAKVATFASSLLETLLTSPAFEAAKTYVQNNPMPHTLQGYKGPDRSGTLSIYESLSPFVRNADYSRLSAEGRASLGSFAALFPGLAQEFQKKQQEVATLEVDRLHVRTPQFDASPYTVTDRPAQVETEVKVDIAPATVNVVLEVDGQRLGQASVKAQQSLARASGGGKTAFTTYSIN